MTDARLETLQKTVHHVALINFGGIGDEILFSPVITEIRKYLPKAHIALILEDRSSSIRPLLPEIDEIIPLHVTGKPRWRVFLELLWLLRINAYNLVISSGSSPFIPLMLRLSGVRQRVGFRTGRISECLLTAAAPLDQRHYAAAMYFSLAKQYLQDTLGDAYSPPAEILPHLAMAETETLAWADALLLAHCPADDPDSAKNSHKIMIHPGVSRISIRKNILKSWGAASWAELISALSGKRNCHVFLVGGPDDEAIISEIVAKLPPNLPHFTNLYGQTRNLKQLAALMTRMEVLVSVDSAPMHLAVGLDRPVVALFGPTDEAKLLPVGNPRFQAVTADSVACRPCLWDTRMTSCDQPVCLNIGVAPVLEAIQRACALKIT